MTSKYLTRRTFLKRTSAGIAAGAIIGGLAPERYALGAGNSDELKIALGFDGGAVPEAPLAGRRYAGQAGS